jgi:hypothetical protein
MSEQNQPVSEATDAANSPVPSAAAQPAVPNVVAVAVHNPRIKFTIVYPDGTRQNKQSDVTGWVHDLQWFEDTVLHGKPILAQVENLRAVGRLGRDLPAGAQPEIFKQHAARKANALKAAGHDPAQRSAAPSSPLARGKALAMARPHLRALIEENGGHEGLIHPGVPQWTPPPPSVEQYDPPEPPRPTGMEPPNPRDVREPNGPTDTLPGETQMPPRRNRK